ncbi:NACHT domain-containing NTPase [Nonomuraea sp. NEAU-A123]|uniref:NACHT domain-containing protein n=1 Tax=Nonomuraea sp. NEAU-A123 TaxID=2839649 RepID=UPI001BE40A30|nr:NACHT domain-containing protein [Nonomuraea sp. NEAU-A123]MBT2229240.1 NACHT domain-containing protein [Nonomuraea sp. NEAU-A123]
MIGKLVRWSLAAIVPPSVAIAGWGPQIWDNPVVTGILLALYEGLLALGLFAGKILGEVAGRWRQRIVDSADRAVGRRVSRFDKRYRESLLGSLRYIDLKGLPTIGYYTPELDEVFIDVSLAYRAPREVRQDVLAQLPAEVIDRHSIGEFLDRRRPVVLAIVGVPGSGKSTLLRHTAQQICRAGRGRRRSVPILLYLRDHAAEIIAAPQVTLPQLVRNTVEPGVKEPAGWFEEKLRDGECVVMLDGLDEVAGQEDRRGVADWVEAQIRRYPKNDYAITSRPRGYLSARIDGATVLQVCSFTDEQIGRFVRSWYAAVEKRGDGTPAADVRRLAEAAADDLLDRLNRTPELYELTINPLLLTMIANVHRHPGSLPESRERLYSEICQVMLWRRHKAKDIPLELSGDKKEVLLRRVALAMMRRGVRDLPGTAVLAEIRPALRRMATKLTAEDFLCDVRSNGLLIEREGDVYSFAHHTFQEYLAAAHIRDKGRPDVLVGAVDDVWWRETTLLYAARSDADPIVAACLSSGTVTALSLAFDCAVEGSELDPALRERLDRLLGSAFTPQADPERRRLMAGVLVARHLRHLTRTGDGGRVCGRPITAGIYWLYVRDTRAPEPDGPARVEPLVHGQCGDDPITGVRARDAAAFVHWVNGVTGNEPGYRLPTLGQIENPAVQRALNPGPPLLSAWSEPGDYRCPVLWTPPGAGDPYAIDAATLIRHVNDDVRRSMRTFVRLLLLRAIVSARVLRRGLDLVPVFDPALDHVRDHAFDLSRTVDHVRGLGDAFGIAHPAGLDQMEADLRELSRCLDHERERAHGLADALAASFSHARTAHSSDALDPMLEPELGLDHAPGLDHAFDRSLDRVMGRALSHALARVLRLNPAPADWPAEFSRAFIEQAGLPAGPYVVPPDTLRDRLRTADKALRSLLGPLNEGPWAHRIADGLRKTAAPVFGRRERLTSGPATTMRLAALCLAAEAGTRGANELAVAFRELAAGITLLERRSHGELPPTETIILATV